MKDDLKAAVEFFNDRPKGFTDLQYQHLQTLITHATENEEELAYNRRFFSLGDKEQRLKDLEKRQAETMKCPSCGGEADNGNDRCLPPNPYVCFTCEMVEKLKEVRDTLDMKFGQRARPKL